jgi:HEPN domain-containing protein
VAASRSAAQAYGADTAAWVVSILNESEYRRWIDIAKAHLAAARHNISVADHVAVLLAEQAVQCGVKAVLHGIGKSRDARGHALVDLLRLAEEQAGLELDGDLRDGVIALARDYQATRYPDVLPGGTPQDHYGTRDAEQATEVAQRTVDSIEARFASLKAGDQSQLHERNEGPDASDDGSEATR